MKTLLYSILALVFTNCIKGENYCEIPKAPTGFLHYKETIKPTESLTLNLNLPPYEEGILYSFTTPSFFKNPTGNRETIILNKGEFKYELKDTINYPDSITISAYIFNDCGRSEPVYAKIKYSNTL